MSVGIVVTKDAVDQLGGGLLREVDRALDRAIKYRENLLRFTDAQLTALGFTQAEVTQLRDAYENVRQLNRIYQGAEALPATKDFRVVFSPLWGINVP